MYNNFYARTTVLYFTCPKFEAWTMTGERRTSPSSFRYDFYMHKISSNVSVMKRKRKWRKVVEWLSNYIAVQ